MFLPEAQAVTSKGTGKKVDKRRKNNKKKEKKKGRTKRPGGTGLDISYFKTVRVGERLLG